MNFFFKYGSLPIIYAAAIIMLTGCSEGKAANSNSSVKPKTSAQVSMQKQNAQTEQMLVHEYLKGEWLCSSSNTYCYQFDGNGGSVFTDRGGSYKGEYKLDGKKISVYEEGKLEDSGYIDEQGRLIMVKLQDGWYYKQRASDIANTVQACDLRAIRPNADYDEDRINLDRGASLIDGRGTYIPVKGQWEITNNDVSDEDGNMPFKFKCLIYDEDMPAGSENLFGSGSIVFYDVNTGLVFPQSSKYTVNGNADHFKYDFVAGGINVSLNIKRMVEREQKEGRKVVTYTYVISKSADSYEGLAAAVIPQPETLAEKNAIDNGSGIAPGVTLDRTGYDFKNAIRCKL